MTKEPSRDAGANRFGGPGTLVLLALADGAKHGYAIMQEIDREMGVSLGPGTLYGAIANLLKGGLIVALPPEDRQRPYEITPGGREALADFVHTWSPIVRLGERRLA